MAGVAGRGSQVCDTVRPRQPWTEPEIERACERKKAGGRGGVGGGKEGKRQGGKSDVASEGRKRLSVCGERRAEGKRDAFAAGGEEGRSVRACIPEE